jgi:hypothetical protein
MQPVFREGVVLEIRLEAGWGCYYGYYMKPVELKVARIGNSRGVRIPATTLARYRIGDSVVMEERTDGILLRPRRAAGQKVSWEDTALAMSAEPEDWSEWNATLADGLNEIPWEPDESKRVAAPRRSYPAKAKRNREK